MNGGVNASRNRRLYRSGDGEGNEVRHFFGRRFEIETGAVAVGIWRCDWSSRKVGNPTADASEYIFSRSSDGARSCQEMEGTAARLPFFLSSQIFEANGKY